MARETVISVPITSELQEWLIDRAEKLDLDVPGLVYVLLIACTKYSLIWHEKPNPVADTEAVPLPSSTPGERS